MKGRTSILVLTFLIITSIQPVIQGFPLEKESPPITRALNFLHSSQGQDGNISGFDLSQWAVMGIAAAGEDPREWKKDEGSPSIIDYLEANAHSLDKETATDVEKWILAIVAGNENPYSFADEDWVEVLLLLENDGQLGDPELLTDDYWGIMALVSAGVSLDHTAIVNSSEFMLSQQGDNGGWGMGPGAPEDADSTSAALMALSAIDFPATLGPIIAALNFLPQNFSFNQIRCPGYADWHACCNNDHVIKIY